MAGKPGKIVLNSDKDKKVATFEKGAFQVLYDSKTRVGGNAGYLTKLAIGHFKEAGRTDLLAVTADEMKDALAAIVARHKPEEGEDEREDFRDYHSDAANDLFARGEWRNKFRVGDEIAYVKSKGHSKDNLAGPDVVNAFVALMDARKEELTKLLDEQPDKDAVVPAACQASRHRGEAKAFQPNQRYAIRWEEGKPVGRKTHAQGGGEIVSGDFLFNDDMAQEIVSSATPEQLKGDLAKLAAESYRLYCRDCQTEANRESKPGEKIIFRTMAWIKHALELKTGRVAGLTEARSFEAGARRRRPPVQESGSRKMNDGWTTRRSRGGR